MGQDNILNPFDQIDWGVDNPYFSTLLGLLGLTGRGVYDRYRRPRVDYSNVGKTNGPIPGQNPNPAFPFQVRQSYNPDMLDHGFGFGGLPTKTITEPEKPKTSKSKRGRKSTWYSKKKRLKTSSYWIVRAKK